MNSGKRFWVDSIVVLICTSGLMACAPRMEQVKEADRTQIKDIQVTEMPSKVEIKVFSDFPLVYTAFPLIEPDRLVIDLAGVDLGSFSEVIPIHQGGVEEIRPIQGDPENGVSSLEIVLVKPLKSNVWLDNGILVIDFIKGSEEKETLAEVDVPERTQVEPDLASETGVVGESLDSEVQEAVSDQSDPVEEAGGKGLEGSEEVLTRAGQVIGISTFMEKDEVRVIVEGDGFLEEESFYVGEDRLVIDFIGTRSFLESHVYPGTGTVLKRIRVGQHSDPLKVRVVLDLSRTIPYEVNQEGKKSVITLFLQPSLDEPKPMPVDLLGSSEASMDIHKIPVALNKNLAEMGLDNNKSTLLELAEKEKIAGKVSESSTETLVSDQDKGKIKSPDVAREKVQMRKKIAPIKKFKSRKEEPLKSSTFIDKGEILHEKKYTGRKISLDFQDADLTNIIRLIADVSKLNVILGSTVKGKVTLKLINIPWDQALDIILKMNGLGQIQEGNIIRIATLADISKQQKAEVDAKQATLEADDLVIGIIPVNYSKSTSLMATLKKSLSSRGDISVNSETNTLIVRDIPKNIDEVRELVRKLDRQIPQVMIEARVVQANISFARDIGVQWGGQFQSQGANFIDYGVRGGNLGLATSPITGFAVNLPASGSAGPLGSLGFTIGRLGRYNLDLRLSAGETTGETKIISTPKITTLDNSEAIIQQGESIPFETISQSGTQTQFIDATLNLTVTPHITPDGSVIIDIKVTKNAIGSFRSSITGTPSIDKRELKTKILIKDGETAVIGGIFESSDTDSMSGVPWFHKAPILGWMFKRESNSEVRRELLIFITPTIIKETL